MTDRNVSALRNNRVSRHKKGKFFLIFKVVLICLALCSAVMIVLPDSRDTVASQWEKFNNWLVNSDGFVLAARFFGGEEDAGGSAGRGAGVGENDGTGDGTAGGGTAGGAGNGGREDGIGGGTGDSGTDTGDKTGIGDGSNGSGMGVGTGNGTGGTGVGVGGGTESGDGNGGTGSGVGDRFGSGAGNSDTGDKTGNRTGAGGTGDVTGNGGTGMGNVTGSGGENGGLGVGTGNGTGNAGTGGRAGSGTANPNGDSYGSTTVEMTRETVPDYVPDGVQDYEGLYPNLYAGRPKDWVIKNKMVFLTFDDGPTVYTERVLDILKEKNVKATFFVVGNSVGKVDNGSAILNRVVNEGHTLAIHCNYHEYKTIYKSVAAYLEDFNTVYELIYDVTGVHADIFRFPGGSNTGYNKAIRQELINEMERRGFTFYDWNASTGDSSSAIDVESAYENATAKSKSVSRLIILIHDTKKASVDALSKIIDRYRELGFNFDRLLNEDKPIVL